MKKNKKELIGIIFKENKHEGLWVWSVEITFGTRWSTINDWKSASFAVQEGCSQNDIVRVLKKTAIRIAKM